MQALADYLAKCMRWLAIHFCCWEYHLPQILDETDHEYRMYLQRNLAWLEYRNTFWVVRWRQCTHANACHNVRHPVCNSLTRFGPVKTAKHRYTTVHAPCFLLITWKFSTDTLWTAVYVNSIRTLRNCDSIVLAFYDDRLVFPSMMTLFCAQWKKNPRQSFVMKNEMYCLHHSQDKEVTTT